MKKVIYIILSIILGLILSLLLHVLIEFSYLKYLESAGKVANWYSISGYASCSLHPAIQIILWIGGFVGGYFLGQNWWRIVYPVK